MGLTIRDNKLPMREHYRRAENVNKCERRGAGPQAVVEVQLVTVRTEVVEVVFANGAVVMA